MAVVAWPEANVSEQMHDLIRELSLHLAAAYFDIQFQAVQCKGVSRPKSE